MRFEVFMVANIKIMVFSVLFYPEGGGSTFLRNIGTYTSTRRHIQRDGNLNKVSVFVISET
jgi:hypothetical protein